MSTFFSTVVQNLNVCLFLDSDPLIWNTEDPNLESILKYWKHPSIISIESKYRYASSFILVEVNETDIEKDILKLNGNKCSQISHIPTKVINGYTNVDLKISIYIWIHIKRLTLKFRFLNPQNSRVICPRSL